MQLRTSESILAVLGFARIPVVLLAGFLAKSTAPVWCCLVALFLANPAFANHRVALVIGNSSYEGKAALPTVEQDAKTIAKLLKERDFRVTTALNRTRDEQRLVINAFIESTPINGTALIYFGGHSMTVRDSQDVAQSLLLTAEGNRKAILLNDVIELAANGSAAKSTIILIDSGKGIPPGFDERRGPKGLNARDKLPDDLWLGFAVTPNTWSEKPGLIAKRLAESTTSKLEPWLNAAIRWKLSTCERNAISKPASIAITPPTNLVRGRKAGDEWVSPDGTVFCWCPESRTEPGFWIGKYEVPQSKHPVRLDRGAKGTHRNDPTNFLKQSDLVEQLKTLTDSERKAGRLPRDWEYVLPSPEQWEYAARAGSEGDRYFARAADLPEHANFADRTLFETGDDLYEYADPKWNDGYAELTPVGGFAPNPWGLHDVFGNVWEQTSNGELRGGSWVSPPEYLKVTVKKTTQPKSRPYPADFVGYRVVIQEVK
jgi:hypothetical protein